MFQTLHEISKNLIFVFVWKYVWKYVKKKKQKQIQKQKNLIEKPSWFSDGLSICLLPLVMMKAGFLTENNSIRCQSPWNFCKNYREWLMEEWERKVKTYCSWTQLDKWFGFDFLRWGKQEPSLWTIKHIWLLWFGFL